MLFSPPAAGTQPPALAATNLARGQALQETLARGQALQDSSLPPRSKIGGSVFVPPGRQQQPPGPLSAQPGGAPLNSQMPLGSQPLGSQASVQAQSYAPPWQPQHLAYSPPAPAQATLHGSPQECGLQGSPLSFNTAGSPAAPSVVPQPPQALSTGPARSPHAGGASLFVPPGGGTSSAAAAPSVSPVASGQSHLLQQQPLGSTSGVPVPVSSGGLPLYAAASPVAAGPAASWQPPMRNESFGGVGAGAAQLLAAQAQQRAAAMGMQPQGNRPFNAGLPIGGLLQGEPPSASFAPIQPPDMGLFRNTSFQFKATPPVTDIFGAGHAGGEPAGGPGPLGHGPPPFAFDRRSTFDFRTEGHAGVHDDFDQPPPPRSAPGFSDPPPSSHPCYGAWGGPPAGAGADLGGGCDDAGLGFEPPPPPRSAPAAAHAAKRRAGPFGGTLPNDGLPLPPPSGSPSPPQPMLPMAPQPMLGQEDHNLDFGGGPKHTLEVRTADNHWQALTFRPGEDVRRAGELFIARHALKAAFLPGLVARLRQMLATGQTRSSVDIVDLI